MFDLGYTSDSCVTSGSGLIHVQDHCFFEDFTGLMSPTGTIPFGGQKSVLYDLEAILYTGGYLSFLLRGDFDEKIFMTSIVDIFR